MVTDPIGDMFARIKNAAQTKKKIISVPHSKLKFEIAKFLEKTGFVSGIVRRGKKNRRSIELDLIYGPDGKSRINEIKRVSKPSRRIYQGWRELKPFKGGLGFYIISASPGIMDEKQARKLKVGGEVLGKIW